MNPQAIWSELRAYPRGVVEEMKKVSWPTRKTTRTLTGIVVAVVGVATLIIGGLDLVFSRIMAIIIGL